jgi:hypothetical protein
VLVGDAVTVAPVVALKPVAGDQLYVVAPLAVSTALPPEQKVAEEGEILTDGEAFTVTVTVEMPVQPPVVPVTVYVVVLVGEAVTVAPVVALKPVAGDQLYVVAPLAVNTVLLPEQMVADEGDTLTVGEELTVTVTVVVPIHPPVVPVMV